MGGMRTYHLKRNKLHCPIVNLDKLVSLLPEEQRSPVEGKASVLDVGKHGFFKVLGKGHLPKLPMIVKAKFFSASAEKKIKEAGGTCILNPSTSLKISDFSLCVSNRQNSSSC